MTTHDQSCSGGLCDIEMALTGWTESATATLQVSTNIPNFLITEYFVNLEGFGQEIAHNPFQVKDGYISIPQGPGLGIELNEDALKQHPYQPFPARSPRQFYEEGP